MKSLAEETTFIVTEHDRVIIRKVFQVTTHNERDTSHNINLSHPTFVCTAFSEAEAVGLMMLSDFYGKNYPIHSITKM